LISIINSVTYVMAFGFMKSIMPFTATLTLTAIFLYSFFKGRFTRPNSAGLVCFLLTPVIITFWLLSGNEHVSNMLLQIPNLISFTPTIVGLYQREIKEKQLPWILMVVSHTFLVLANIIGQSEWESLVYPGLNCLGNIVVVILIHNRKSIGKSK
jgi:hypothetical protein